ncbi:unnamed protein product, partial [Phaeothamnion confervicola]
QVVLTPGASKVLSCWKRFKDFVALAAAISETGKLPRSEYAWENVQRSRKWFRCLDEDYVRAKSVSLSIFLGQVLFEIETPKLLTDFVLSNAGREVTAGGLRGGGAGGDGGTIGGSVGGGGVGGGGKGPAAAGEAFPKVDDIAGGRNTSGAVGACDFPTH